MIQDEKEGQRQDEFEEAIGEDFTDTEEGGIALSEAVLVFSPRDEELADDIIGHSALDGDRHQVWTGVEITNAKKRNNKHNFITETPKYETNREYADDEYKNRIKEMNSDFTYGSYPNHPWKPIEVDNSRRLQEDIVAKDFLEIFQAELFAKYKRGSENACVHERQDQGQQGGLSMDAHGRYGFEDENEDEEYEEADEDEEDNESDENFGGVDVNIDGLEDGQDVSMAGHANGDEDMEILAIGLQNHTIHNGLDVNEETRAKDSRHKDGYGSGMD